MLQVTRPGRFPRFTPLAPLLVLAAAPSASAAPAVPHAHGDHLTVTVQDAGSGADGTYEVECHPSHGSHPDVGAACAALDRNTQWGRDTFAPVPNNSICTMQYGGAATAHVTGTWAGRPVDARFDRSDGCDVARWDRFVPLLPELGAPRA